ncbi:xanthine dehydrogenase family protein [Ahrensia sp. AH-315-G08]|nr:xanthine dehydrogenase family protein [Ahrensia sp. AH-315-G08]
MTQVRKGRIEDIRLTTGAGRFTDDLRPVSVLHLAFARSAYASGTISAIDCEEAKGMPGVVAVFTASDLQADGVGNVTAAMKLTGPDGHEWLATPRELLVSRTVRHLGEPFAMVVAKSRAEAISAAEAVSADIDETDPVVTLEAARAENAALVHNERPGNVGVEWQRGDWDKVGKALQTSAHVVTLDTIVTRVAVVAMEPRSALAQVDTNGDDARYTLNCSHQNPMAFRPALAKAFGLRNDQIRVVAEDVGGSFGMKAGPLREEMLVFWAAKFLEKTVRWRADRSEGFMSDEAGRDTHFKAELGLDVDGKFTALQVAGELNVGAYCSGRSLPMVFNFGGIAGVYQTPEISGRLRGILTNTVPIAAYRGAGRPEATFVIEQLIDKAARQLNIDRIDLRRRNMIQPEKMPWKTKFIFDYDCGNFEIVLDAGMDIADFDGFESRRADSESKGKLRGLGLAMCIETAGGIYGSPGKDFANLEFDIEGNLTLAMGVFSAGQGLETVFTDLAAKAMQIPTSKIRYVQGDTDFLDKGKGMGGSAAMVQGGSALRDGADKLIAKARDIAAEQLEVAAVDLEYENGVFTIAGTDRQIAIEDVAKAAIQQGVRLLGEGEFAPESSTFPNGCHVCEIEIDPDTGLTTIERYSAVEDIGKVINHQLAEGQVQGGIVQGLGQIFFEDVRYEADTGQLLSGSFMDYTVPHADHVPDLHCVFHEVPTDLNPLEVKGVGEAGTVGAMAAGMSAVTDALTRAGVEDFNMPATPNRVWEALQKARK